MSTVATVASIHDYHVSIQQPTRHPLVSVIDFSQVAPLPRPPQVQALRFGFYGVFLKEAANCTLRYGRHTYDFQGGTLVFVAPGQVVSMEEDGPDYQPQGHALLFHSDLLRGTSLGAVMEEYTFFSYAVREALHLSEQEKHIVLDCFGKITYEVQHALDRHSKRLLVANIELFLNYCVRFYDRQFISREVANTAVIEKVERLLGTYFASDKPQIDGLPTVSWLAGELHLSANYLGDLLKKETGKTALDYIHAKLLALAKEKLFAPSKSVSEVAYELGFKYPQHFTRFFKQQVGQSPQHYRSLN